MTFIALLKADAERQYHYAGRKVEQVTLGGLMKTCFSPRFVPVLLFRLGSWCAGHHLRPFGKVLSLLNFLVFGLEIGLDCPIGPGLYFPHTSGTVIGARRIGANAVIYHNVTLGAKVPDLSYEADLRPEVGDDAFLGAGCKILGGISLGDHVTVGANSVVLKSVPSGCLVGGVPAVVLRQPEV
jgi:serine O-acetyltransferase